MKHEHLPCVFTYRGGGHVYLWYVIDIVAPDKLSTCVCKGRLEAFMDAYYL